MTRFARSGRSDMETCGRLADDIAAELSAMALVTPTRDTDVIHRPACEGGGIGMASLARLRSGKVHSWALAYDAQILSVMTGSTSSCDTDVIKEFHLEAGGTGMTGIARLACRDMGNRLGSGANAAAGGMTPFTVSRGILKDSVHVSTSREYPSTGIRCVRGRKKASQISFLWLLASRAKNTELRTAQISRISRRSISYSYSLPLP